MTHSLYSRMTYPLLIVALVALSVAFYTGGGFGMAIGLGVISLGLVFWLG